MSKPNIYNPYRRNLEVMQGFFKKPLVLITAIVCALYALANPIFLFINVFAGKINLEPDFYSIFSLCSFLFFMMPAVSYFLLFSRFQTQFNTAKIISYIYSIAGIAVTACAAVVILGYKMNLIFIIPIIFLLIVTVIHLIAHMKTFASIKKSLSSIYLVSRGSTLLTVTSFLGVIFGLLMVAGGVTSIFQLFANSNIALPYTNIILSDISLSNDLSIYIIAIGTLLLIKSLLVAIFSIAYRRYIRRLKTVVNISAEPVERAYVQTKKPIKQKKAKIINIAKNQEMQISVNEIDSYYFETPQTIDNPYATRQSKKQRNQDSDNTPPAQPTIASDFIPQNPFEQN